MDTLAGLRTLSEAATPGPWHAYFTVQGDPFVVTDPEHPFSGRIADVSVAPADYGRADTTLIVAAVDFLRDVLDGDYVLIDREGLAAAFRQTGFSVAYDSDAIPMIADAIIAAIRGADRG